MPLIRMNPDDHFRFMIAVMFCLLSVFLMTAIFALIVVFPAASTAWKNTAGTREQGDHAY